MGVSSRDVGGGLAKTHKKTKAVQKEVLHASDNVGVIGTVLAQELPQEVLVGEVAQALEQTEQLEQKLAESAATLADVTAELGREVEKRRKVTEKLDASRAQVDKLASAAAKKSRKSRVT